MDEDLLVRLGFVWREHYCGPGGVWEHPTGVVFNDTPVSTTDFILGLLHLGWDARSYVLTEESFKKDGFARAVGIVGAGGLEPTKKGN